MEGFSWHGYPPFLLCLFLLVVCVCVCVCVCVFERDDVTSGQLANSGSGSGIQLPSIGVLIPRRRDVVKDAGRWR